MSVFTTVNSTQLESFLENYSIGALISFNGIAAGVTNSNFFVDTNTGRYILTIVEHENATDVEWFMQLLAFLHKNNIPCAMPFLSANNNYTQTLAGKPATLVECLNGADKTVVNTSDCHALGTLIAQLHKVCRDYPHHRADTRGGQWRLTTARQVESFLTPEEKSLLDDTMNAVAKASLNNLPKSVIHADLFRDNVLFESNELSTVSGIIDFYYACNGCMLYDLAIVFNDWCRVDTVVDRAKAHALLAGYQSVRPLSAAEQHAWPQAIQCAALRFWLSRLQDLHFPPQGAITNTLDPAAFQQILLQPCLEFEDLASEGFTS